MIRPIVRLAGVALASCIPSIAIAQSASCLKPQPVLMGDTPFANQASFGAQLCRTSTGFGEDYLWRAGWFAFTPDVTAKYTIGVCGASVDTKLALGAACPLAPDTAWSVLGYNDDACAFTGGSGLWASRMSPVSSGIPLGTELIAGTTYLIAVAGYGFSTAPAAGSLSIEFVPPPVDPCATAADGAIGTNAVAMLDASPSLDTDCGSIPYTVSRVSYLRFTAPYTGRFAASTCLQTADTVVAVLGACAAGTTVIACDDDTCGAASRAIFNADAGSTVYIGVGMYSPTAPLPQSIPVEIEALGAPPDPCASIATLSQGANVLTLDPGMPNLVVTGTFAATVHHANYCAFTAPAAGVYRVSTCTNTTFDSILVRSAQCDNGTAVEAIDDDGCGITGGPSQLRFFSEAGATTLFGIGAWSSVDPMPAAIAVSVDFIAPPSDGCAAGNVINGVVGIQTVPMSLTYRKLDLAGYCDPGPSGNDAIACARTIRFTAARSGSHIVATCSDTDPANTGRVDSRLAVLTRCGDPSSVIACDDDGCTGGIAPFTSRLSFTAAAGTTYYIVVGGFNDLVSGPLHLEIIEPVNPADINGDGRVDASDLATLLGQWGTGGSADIDRNGVVGGSDLALLLGAWG